MYALSGELSGVQERLCNADHFIIFQTVIVQLARNATGMQAIRWSIMARLDAWEVVKHKVLVEDTVHTCKHYLSESCCGD